ncbi:hypothetical protein PSW65_23370, partial [Shigella flexneri]|nr:hypothetical protein [Shigella flexneri]
MCTNRSIGVFGVSEAHRVRTADTMSFGYAKNTYTAVGTNNNSGLDIIICTNRSIGVFGVSEAHR